LKFCREPRKILVQLPSDKIYFNLGGELMPVLGCISKLVAVFLIASCSLRNHTSGAQILADSKHLSREIDAPDLLNLLPDTFEWNAIPAEPLTVAEALDDFRYVEYMLRTTYSGFEAQANLGFDWNRYFLSTKALIESKEQWPAASYADLLLELPKNQIDDGHLSVVVIKSVNPPVGEEKNVVHRWHSYIRAGAEAGGNASLKGCVAGPSQTMLGDQKLYSNGSMKTVDVVQVRDSIDHVVCNGNDSAVREWKADMPVHGPVFEEKLLPTSDAYYVRMASLSPQAVENTSAFLRSASNAKKHKNVILQLRGGGDPEIVVNWLKGLGIRGTIKMPFTKEVESTGTNIARSYGALAAIAMLEGDSSPEAKQRIKDLKAIQQAASSDAKAAIASGEVYDRRFKDNESGNVDLGDGSFSGTLTVLIDEHCASACEHSVFYLKQIPGVRVLGSSTLGMNAFDEPMQIMLPHSKLWYAVPIWMAYIGPNNTPAEGKGVTPTIWAAGDLLGQALEILK